MVRKVILGWRVEWSEERYTGEEDSGTTTNGKDEVRGLTLMLTQLTIKHN